MNNYNLSEKIRKAVAESNSKNIIGVLQDLQKVQKLKPKEFLSVHDAILFSIAYSPNKETKAICEKSLNQLLSEDKGDKNKMQDSGITGTKLVSIFSLELLFWLNNFFPENVSFHSFNNEKQDVGEEMKILLPNAESEVLTFGWGKNKLFQKLCGGKITIERLLNLFSGYPDKKISSMLFSKVGVYVEIDFAKAIVSKSTARSISYNNFYHPEILRKIDLEKIISSKIPNRQKISQRDKNTLAENARMMLVSLGRETDPVTNCSIEETEFYVLDRGFAISLFYLSPEYRLAFDGYVGYMMYKNGLPISYGGAWILFDKALIGINIFDAHRGGESGYLFSQLLRVYKHRFNVNTFSVEPYQYGKNNPEGIQSGAYWFYYRFGFRSDDEEIKAIAEDERMHILKEPNYKTPTEVLRKFTKSNITLKLKNSNTIFSSQLSLKITEFVAINYLGNRKMAIKEGEKKLKQIFGFPKNKHKVQEVWKSWCLAILVLATLKNPSSAQKKIFHQLLEDKSFGKEVDYLFKLNKLSSVFF